MPWQDIFFDEISREGEREMYKTRFVNIYDYIDGVLDSTW